MAHTSHNQEVVSKVSLWFDTSFPLAITVTMSVHHFSEQKTGKLSPSWCVVLSLDIMWESYECNGVMQTHQDSSCSCSVAGPFDDSFISVSLFGMPSCCYCLLLSVMVYCFFLV